MMDQKTIDQLKRLAGNDTGSRAEPSMQEIRSKMTEAQQVGEVFGGKKFARFVSKKTVQRAIQKLADRVTEADDGYVKSNSPNEDKKKLLLHPSAKQYYHNMLAKVYHNAPIMKNYVQLRKEINNMSERNYRRRFEEGVPILVVDMETGDTDYDINVYSELLVDAIKNNRDDLFLLDKSAADYVLKTLPWIVRPQQIADFIQLIAEHSQENVRRKKEGLPLLKVDKDGEPIEDDEPKSGNDTKSTDLDSEEEKMYQAMKKKWEIDK